MQCFLLQSSAFTYLFPISSRINRRKCTFCLLRTSRPVVFRGFSRGGGTKSAIIFIEYPVYRPENKTIHRLLHCPLAPFSSFTFFFAVHCPKVSRSGNHILSLSSFLFVVRIGQEEKEGKIFNEPQVFIPFQGFLSADQSLSLSHPIH